MADIAAKREAVFDKQSRDFELKRIELAMELEIRKEAERTADSNIPEAVKD